MKPLSSKPMLKFSLNLLKIPHHFGAKSLWNISVSNCPFPARISLRRWCSGLRILLPNLAFPLKFLLTTRHFLAPCLLLPHSCSELERRAGGTKDEDHGLLSEQFTGNSNEIRKGRSQLQYEWQRAQEKYYDCSPWDPLTTDNTQPQPHYPDSSLWFGSSTMQATPSSQASPFPPLLPLLFPPALPAVMWSCTQATSGSLSGPHCQASYWKN